MEADKRFLVFGYSQYYPSGGLCDLIDSFDTVEEAIAETQKGIQEFYDVYDRVEGVNISLD